MAAQRKVHSVWQYFDEESDNNVVCQLCAQKLTHNHSAGVMRNHSQLKHLDIKLQGQQATITNTQQTSFTACVTPTHRRCDADRSEKITQLITEMTVRDLLPLCFVEGNDFHKLKHFTEPEHTTQSHTMDTSWLEPHFSTISIIIGATCRRLQQHLN